MLRGSCRPGGAAIAARRAPVGGGDPVSVRIAKGGKQSMVTREAGVFFASRGFNRC